MSSNLPHSVISAAANYAAAAELGILTTYYNPSRFQTKLHNFREFIAPFASWTATQVVIVECAFGDEPFALPATPHTTLRCRGKDVMWQKERLLNIALEALPSQYRYVAWIDADVLFANPRWAVDACEALTVVPVVQLFRCAFHLPRGATSHTFTGEGTDPSARESFGAVHERWPEAVAMGANPGGLPPFHHGHPGFGWAARRSFLDERGFYDHCIMGGGDHAMVHAMCGDTASTCVAQELGLDTPAHRAFVEWADAVHGDVRGRVGHVPGELLHLWHGDMKNRNYGKRYEALISSGFDPKLDLRRGASNLWEWTPRGERLRAAFSDFFDSRREDGGEA
jgi:hypothetical protein